MYSVPEKLPTDPVLADLVPEFLEQWARDLTVTFADIVESKSLEDLNRFGHTIKGSFLQFGFKELSSVGRDIMKDAEVEDWDAAQTRVHDILSVVQAIQQLIAKGEIS